MNTQLKTVLENLIAKMESGELNWSKPWTAATLPHNYQSGRAYSGFNLFLTMFSGFSESGYMTFNQVREAGGKVIKGSKATPIIFWQVGKKAMVNAAGEMEDKKYFLCKLYHVFNQTQIEGVDFKTTGRKELTDVSEVVKLAEKMGVKVEHIHADQACYAPGADRITMPFQKSFVNDAAYMQTLFHEMIHATGSKNRLDRDLKGFRMDKNSYSFEELVAELGACFLSAIHNVENSVDNSAAYMQCWAKHLKADPSILYKAAVAAQKAVDYIMDPETPEVKEEPEFEIEEVAL